MRAFFNEWCHHNYQGTSLFTNPYHHNQQDTNFLIELYHHNHQNTSLFLSRIIISNKMRAFRWSCIAITVKIRASLLSGIIMAVNTRACVLTEATVWVVWSDVMRYIGNSIWWRPVIRCLCQRRLPHRLLLKYPGQDGRGNNDDGKSYWRWPQKADLD